MGGERRHRVLATLSHLAGVATGAYGAAQKYSAPAILGAGLQVKALRYEMPRLLRQLHGLKARLKRIHTVIKAAPMHRCGLGGLVNAVSYAEDSIVQLFGSTLAQAFTLTGVMWYVATVAALEAELALEVALFVGARHGLQEKCNPEKLVRKAELHEDAQDAISSAIARLGGLSAGLGGATVEVEP